MTETLSNNEWSNDNHGLSAETHDYKSNDNLAESNPINEGFIILSDNQKTHSSSTKTTTTAGPNVKKQTSTIRTLSNITTTTTTCKTKHKITSTSTSKTTTTTMKKTPNQTMNSNVVASPARRGRRLLNDPSYDTDNDLSLKTTLPDDDSDVDSFLRVNDAELSNQLVNMAVMADGSGFSMY